MGDQGAQPQQVNGTAARAAVPELLKGPSAVAQAQARIRAGRASTLAALESGDTSDAPAELETTVAAEVEADDADQGGGIDAKAESKPAAPKPAEKKDPETEKRLESVQAAEKRSRDKITAERASLKADIDTFDKLKAEHAPRLEKLEKFEAAMKKIHVDPEAALAQLELGDDAAREAISRAIFATTEAGKKDPAAAKAQASKAAELLRNREHETKLERMERELKETRELITKGDQAREQQARVSRYVGEIEAAAKADPLVVHLMTSDPDDAHDGLSRTYAALLKEHDEEPDAADVVAAFGKAQRAKFTKLGIDPESLLKNDPKKNIQAADKKHPAKTLGNDLSTPRVPRPAKSDREHRAETLAMLESGKLET